jgi:hypothetical protein
MTSEVRIQDRWGTALKNGFVVVPVSLLRRQGALGIENTEMVVLLQLLAHWHEDEKPVWAAYSSFAKEMGVSERTVQRAISSLAEKKLVEIERRLEGRVVTFNGLIQRLNPRGG